MPKRIGTNCSLFAQLNYEYFISALSIVNFKNSFGLFFFNTIGISCGNLSIINFSKMYKNKTPARGR